MIGRTARRTARLRERAPLDRVGGLAPVRLLADAELLHRTAGACAQDVLLARFPPLADPAATPLALRFSQGEILRADGSAWGREDPVVPGDELWFHRERRDEAVPEVELPILLHDEHLLAVDKPHDLATMPRGQHVLASALVRLRALTGIEDLTPLHRLDRRTAGVLLLGIVPAERGAYQGVFARAAAHKEYRALVADAPEAVAGRRLEVSVRLERTPGDLRTRVVPGTANSRTLVELGEPREAGAREVRLWPRTGRTHQLRAHLAHLGMPILGDDLYPVVRPVQECGGTLRLLARSLRFTDPVTGAERSILSTRELDPWAVGT
ncbi:pseudouridine synthase [Brachybacterium sp. AOP25-B2-12]|uniref:pseudouridine synthase n=1 Tax=Brachybacterium sp. AOP25-B2-12 TaxID=3457710 RepID=UPI004034D012